ncbi:MAG: O-antigen ligase family protein [Patescibacteria group bacterium]
MFALLPFALPFYLVRTNIGPLPTTGLELVIIATVIGWVGKGIGHWALGIGIKHLIQEAWEAFRPWRWPVGLWVIAGAISVFAAHDHIAALGLYRAYFIEPVLIFIIGLQIGAWGVGRLSPVASAKGDGAWEENRTPNAERRTLLSSFAIVLILLGLYSIVQFLTGWGIPYPWHEIAGRRAVGPFPYPNALSLFVTPVAALLFADVLRGLSDSRAVGWARQRRAPTDTTTHGLTDLRTYGLSFLGFLFGVISIALAESIGGMIALATAMFVASMFYKRARIIAISMLIAIVIGIGLIAPLREKIVSVVTFQQWSGMVRTVMWKESVAMLKDHSIFGAGLGGYPAAIKPYHKATWMEIFQYPHDIVLNLWSETGVLGLVAFGWIIAEWAWGVGRGAWSFYTLRPTPHALSVITAILIHGLVDVPYFKNDLAVAFWLLILITQSRIQKLEVRS